MDFAAASVQPLGNTPASLLYRATSKTSTLFDKPPKTKLPGVPSVSLRYPPVAGPTKPQDIIFKSDITPPLELPLHDAKAGLDIYVTDTTAAQDYGHELDGDEAMNEQFRRIIEQSRARQLEALNNSYLPADVKAAADAENLIGLAPIDGNLVRAADEAARLQLNDGLALADAEVEDIQAQFMDTMAQNDDRELRRIMYDGGRAADASAAADALMRSRADERNRRRSRARHDAELNRIAEEGATDIMRTRAKGKNASNKATEQMKARAKGKNASNKATEQMKARAKVKNLRSDLERTKREIRPANESVIDEIFEAPEYIPSGSSSAQRRLGRDTLRLTREALSGSSPPEKLQRRFEELMKRFDAI